MPETTTAYILLGGINGWGQKMMRINLLLRKLPLVLRKRKLIIGKYQIEKHIGRTFVVLRQFGDWSD